jgi:hypothetical protein
MLMYKPLRTAMAVSSVEYTFVSASDSEGGGVSTNFLQDICIKSSGISSMASIKAHSLFLLFSIIIFSILIIVIVVIF